MRWLDFRGRFGFSEYNSDTYAPIAFNALVTVAGSAPDEDIRTLATIITYLQLFDWVIGAHKGRVLHLDVEERSEELLAPALLCHKEPARASKAGSLWHKRADVATSLDQ